jgi:3D (Asp-Asp-Asp) domain-containing protein
MTNKLGPQPEAIVNGPWEGRNAEAVQKNFEKIFRRMRGFDGGLLGIPQAGNDGDLVYFEDGEWKSLSIGAANTILTSDSGLPAWAAPAQQNDYMGLVEQAQWAILGRSVVVGVGIVNPTISGTSTAIHFADSSYARQTSGAVAGNSAAIIGSLAGSIQIQHDPIFTVVMRTDASITGARFFFGLTGSNFSNADEPGGISEFIAFRYSTVVPDAGWVGLTRDGTTPSATAQVAAIASDTRYKLKIRVTGSGTSVYFSVNDGTEVLKTTNLPALTSSLFPWLGVFNTAGVARIWYLSRAHCRYGS